jgi:predicted metal-dependent hydrolase
MVEAQTIETPLGACQLKRSDRRTLSISVLPDGAVELTAPYDSHHEDIVKKVIKRRSWIQRQRRDFAEMNAARSTPRYCSGATHRYLGRQYRLRIQQAKTESVKLIGGYFHIQTQNQDHSHVATLLETWMRDHALNQFSNRTQKWIQWCQHRKLATPQVRLRKMINRWGSAHSSGIIYLNPNLVRMPSICIDYVITHEVCHLQHPNHDQSFYRLLSELCPNWRQIKLRLEKSDF